MKENNYLLFLFLLILVLLFLLIFIFFFKKELIISFKKISFECGIDSWGINENLFSIRFFFVGIIFLIFDIEIIILYPIFLKIKIYFLLIMIFLILYSLVYEWINNSLVWK